MASGRLEFRWRSKEGQPSEELDLKPRHGHRAALVNQLLIILGGGNEGIIDDLLVYNTISNRWYKPIQKGQVPKGRAAFGLAVQGTRVLLFGGMIEYGGYSNELYELEVLTWQWKRFGNGLPTPRIGHSFTLLGDTVYTFGGLAHGTRFLNDLYALHLSNLSWEPLKPAGVVPLPRESHTAVAYNRYVVVFGGMSGFQRLGDVWLLNTKPLSWIKPTVVGRMPMPCSLHTSVLIGSKMYVFGGWVPILHSEWVCSDSFLSLDLETFVWEKVPTTGDVPTARTGHCAVADRSRMYIWSGRHSQVRRLGRQVCGKRLWYVDTERPDKPARVCLVKSESTSLTVKWTPSPTADKYVLQIRTAPSKQPVPEIKKPKCVKITIVNGQIQLKPNKSDNALTENTSEVNNNSVLEPKWHTVAFTSDTMYTVKTYSVVEIDFDELTSDDLPQLHSAVPITPVTSYEIRVTAVNALGAGPCGEPSVFKTKSLRVPQPPRNVKIDRTANGINMMWKHTDADVKYAVYVATAEHRFKCVYNGGYNTCRIPASVLRGLAVDTTGPKATLLFRIRAQNVVGFGPFMQIRWTVPPNDVAAFTRS